MTERGAQDNGTESAQEEMIARRDPGGGGGGATERGGVGNGSFSIIWNQFDGASAASQVRAGICYACKWANYKMIRLNDPLLG